MHSDRIEKALYRVKDYLEATIRLETKPSDNEYDMAEHLLKIIDEELKKK